jgi:hypothetical protein
MKMVVLCVGTMYGAWSGSSIIYTKASTKTLTLFHIIVEIREITLVAAVVDYRFLYRLLWVIIERYNGA